MVEFLFDDGVPQEVRTDHVFQRLATALTKFPQVKMVKVSLGSPYGSPRRPSSYVTAYDVECVTSKGEPVRVSQWGLCIAASGFDGNLCYEPRTTL